MKVAELFIVLDTKLDRFNKGMSDAENAMVRVGKKFEKVGKKMTMMVTLPILALGAAAVKVGADFEQSMTNAFAVTGAESEEVKEKMEALARTMGEKTVFSAKEAADAMYFMASAGWKVEQMTDALEPTLALAAATQSDLAFATETVIVTLNQFGLQSSEAARISNVFAAAISSSQATLDRLRESMKYIGPMADSMGWSIEDTTAILMLFYEQGIDASMAGTALRMAFSQLAAGTPKTQKALKELGLTMADVNPETKSLGDIFDLLSSKTISLEQAIKIFGVRAGPPMLKILRQGSDAFVDFKDKITGTQAASEMARKQLDTFKGSFKLLTSALTESAIQISKILIPILRDLIDNHIKPAVLWFNNLSEGTKKAIVTFAGLAAAAGPLLLILGKIMQILPHLKVAFLAVSKVLKGVAFNLVAVILAFKSFERYFPLVGKALEDVKNKAETLRKELGLLVGWEEFDRAVEKAGLATGEFAAMAREAGYDVEKFLKIMVKEGRKNAADYMAIYTSMTKEKEELLKREKKLAEDLHKIEQWAIDDIEAHRKAVKAKIIAYHALKGDVESYIEKMEERIRIEETDADIIKERITKLKETTTAEGLLYDALGEVNEALKKSKSLTLEERDQLELTKEAIERKIEALLDAGKAQKTLIEAIEFTITAEMELARQFGEGKISIIEYTEGLQKLREEAERIKDPLKDLAMREGDIRLETEGMTNAYGVLEAAGVPKMFYDQLTAIEKLKLEAIETTDVITIRFKSMIEHILDFTRDLAAGWADVFVGMLGITESITYQMKEFDNSYWENALLNAQETYDAKKSLLEQQLMDAATYYTDLEEQLTDDYEKRKKWIEANVEDEEKKQEMLLELETKHQTDLENIRADQLQKEQDLQDSLVELEENHQTESERIRDEEDAAREQHATDEYDRQNTLWNKVKGVFGDAVDNMLYTWTTDLIQGMLLGVTDVAKGLVSQLAGAFKTVKSDAVSTASKVTSEMGGIAGFISGIGTAIAGVITTLATAIATAATTLAAAAPALLVVLGIALAAYAGFKLISSLFKKKPETGTMEAILRDISHIQLAALLDKMDESNFFASEMFPKIDYTNSILAKIENISKGIRGYSRKIESGVNSIVKKLESLTGFQAGGYVPKTQLAVVHAGETIISPTITPPTGIPGRGVVGGGAQAGVERQHMTFFFKPLVIPRGDKYIVDFVLEEIKHGRKIPIEAIGG